MSHLVNDSIIDNMRDLLRDPFDLYKIKTSISTRDRKIEEDAEFLDWAEAMAYLRHNLGVELRAHVMIIFSVDPWHARSLRKEPGEEVCCLFTQLEHVLTGNPIEE